MFDILPVDRPYPGLRPFEPWESSIFFGREAHTDRLLTLLDEHHFLVVTGPSGSGKSSLVRAGLLPALPLGTIGSGGGWRLALMRPGDRPMRRLAQALAERHAFAPEVARWTDTGPDGPDPAAGGGEALLLAELNRGKRGLVDVVADLRLQAKQADFDVLLLVDQFEEIFTHAQAGGRDAGEAQAFVDLLLEAAAVRDSGIYIVLTMRTDFLGPCTRFQGLPEAINVTGYLTPRLARADLTRAIAAPARVFGGELDAELTTELVNAVQQDPDQLPVLQHALARMWDRQPAGEGLRTALGLKDLRRVGGVGAALSEHADELVRNLHTADPGTPAPKVLLLVQWLFRCLSDQRSAEAGGQLVRRPQALSLIAQASGQTWQAYVPILRAFAQPSASFLTYAGQAGEPAQGSETVVDISHEALLRQWMPLKAWVAAEAQAATRYRDLQRRAAQSGSVLTGIDLSLATQWLATGLRFEGQNVAETGLSAPTEAWSARYPGPADFAAVEALHQRSQDDADATRRREYRRTLAMRSVVGCVFVMGLVAMGVGYWGYQQGLDARAQAMWHRLAFDGRGGLQDEDIISGLLSLARADRDVRRAASQTWLGNEVLARQLVSSGQYLLNASLGLDSDLRQELASVAFKNPKPADSDEVVLARAHLAIQLGLMTRLDAVIAGIERQGQRLGVDIENTRSTEVIYRLADLSRGGHQLAGSVSLAERDSWEARILQAMSRSNNLRTIAALGRVLAGLPGPISDSAADAATRHVLAAARPFEVEGERNRNLDNGLVVLLRSFNASQKQRYVSAWMAAWRAPHKPHEARLLTLYMLPASEALPPDEAKLWARELAVLIGNSELNASLPNWLTASESDAAETASASRARLRGPALQALAEALHVEYLGTTAEGPKPLDLPGGMGRRADLAEALGPVLESLPSAMANGWVNRLKVDWAGRSTANMRRSLRRDPDNEDLALLASALTALNDVDLAAAASPVIASRAPLRAGQRPPLPGMERALFSASHRLPVAQFKALVQPALFSAEEALLSGSAAPYQTKLDWTPLSWQPADAAASAFRLLFALDGLLSLRDGWRSTQSEFKTSEHPVLIHALRLLVKDLQPAEMLAVSNRAAELAKRNSGRAGKSLAGLLGDLTARLPPEFALTDTLQSLLKAGADPALKNAIKTSAAKLDATARSAMVNDMLAKLEKSDYGDDAREKHIRLLGLMVQTADAAQAPALADAMLKTVPKLKAKGFPVDLIEVWGDALMSLPAEALAAHAEGLIAGHLHAESPILSIVYGNMVSRWPEKALSKPEQIPVWVRFCKSPFADRQAIVAALRKVDGAGPAAEAGDFAYLTWAAQKYGVDVRSPLE